MPQKRKLKSKCGALAMMEGCKRTTKATRKSAVCWLPTLSQAWARHFTHYDLMWASKPHLRQTAICNRDCRLFTKHTRPFFHSDGAVAGHAASWPMNAFPSAPLQLGELWSLSSHLCQPKVGALGPRLLRQWCLCFLCSLSLPVDTSMGCDLVSFMRWN